MKPIPTKFPGPVSEIEVLDEAREVFRCAVQELVARAQHLGVPQLIREHAALAAEDVLTDLFYEREIALKEELGEE